MSGSVRRLHLVPAARLGARPHAIIAILVCNCLSVLAGVAQAREENLSRSGQADRSVLIREHAGWNDDCKPIAHPPLYLLSPPHHGKVCAQAEEIKITSMYVGTESQCVGHMVYGVRLIYRPDPSFVGDDRIQYAAQYPSVLRMISVKVTVTPYPARKSGAAPSVNFAPVTAMRQLPGPVPECAEFVF
jgi:hypothetical protein